MNEATTRPHPDIEAMVASLPAGGTPGRPVRHQAIVLLWALGRASRREPRLVRWSEARAELRDLLDRFGLPESRPTPEYPFVALARTDWWDLSDAQTQPPAAHKSLPLTWLTAENPRGGLERALHLLFIDDERQRNRAVQALLARFFAGQPADDLLAAVGLPAPSGTARLNWVWDELVLACDLLVQNDWHELPAEDPRVVELSALLQRLPLHPVGRRGPTFRSPSSVRRKMADIATQHPDNRRRQTNGNKLDKEVLTAFIEQREEMHLRAEELRSGAFTGAFDRLPEVNGADEVGVVEGRLLERRYYARERNPALRAKKIRSAMAEHGCIECEVCGFDFARTYGGHGAEYAECHHAVPLHASGGDQDPAGGPGPSLRELPPHDPPARSLAGTGAAPCSGGGPAVGPAVALAVRQTPRQRAQCHGRAVGVAAFQ